MTNREWLQMEWKKERTRLAKELRIGETHFQIHTKPDHEGNQTWTLFWRTNYIPGHPDGEYREDYSHVRAQHYNANLEQWMNRYTEENRDFSVDNSRVMRRA